MATWKCSDWEEKILLTKKILDTIDLTKPEPWTELALYRDFVAERECAGITLPEEFYGDIFNFMDLDEFGAYLEKRFGIKIEEKITYYIV